MVRKSISANHSVAALGRLSVVSETSAPTATRRNHSRTLYKSSQKVSRAGVNNSMVIVEGDQDSVFSENYMGTSNDQS
jgi:hypothetical protein